MKVTDLVPLYIGARMTYNYLQYVKRRMNLSEEDCIRIIWLLFLDMRDDNDPLRVDQICAALSERISKLSERDVERLQQLAANYWYPKEDNNIILKSMKILKEES